MKMLYDNVMIKEREPEQVTPGGLIVAHLEQEGGVRQGIVISAGPDAPVTGGDKVIYIAYGETEYTFDGVDYSIVKSPSILAVVGE